MTKSNNEKPIQNKEYEIFNFDFLILYKQKIAAIRDVTINIILKGPDIYLLLFLKFCITRIDVNILIIYEMERPKVK